MKFFKSADIKFLTPRNTILGIKKYMNTENNAS